MSSYVRKIASLILLSFAASGCASSNGPAGSIEPMSVTKGPSAAPQALPLIGHVLDTRISTSAPAGYISFCLRFPDQCEVSLDSPSAISLDQQKWTTLREVNSSVNNAIKPLPDIKHYGRAEYWNIPSDGYGDCEDYALTKRKALITSGFSQNALRLALVRDWRGERHAVLTVSTDRGDYVLDNLDQDIVAADKIEYEWVERQDPTQAWGWIALVPTRTATHLAAAAITNPSPAR